MNRQTSKLLNILLNSPGQYFHYEELAARFQVSTRSIRNYTQSILDFLEDLQMPSALTVSEGGIAFTGGAEESSLLLQAAVDNDFYLYRLSPEERSHIILLNLLISDDYCNIYDLSEKFNVSRTTILKDMEQVKAFLARYNCTFDPAMNRGLPAPPERTAAQGHDCPYYPDGHGCCLFPAPGSEYLRAFPL